ncbi:MAG: TlpA disulfide reductase family protein, partial [Chloroflexota bacterium]
RLADRRGRPVLVNFWASWCPPCREEAPRLERLWREYRERGVAVVGIDVWDTERDARRFLREAGVTYPNGPDPGGRIAMDFGVAGVPETVLIDGDGQIARKWIGPFTEAAAQVFRRDVVALGDG